jgi:anti-sigma factor RsiW
MRLPRIFRRRRPPDLACVEFVELVTEYLEGTMPAADRRRVEAHLEACDGCDRYLEQIRTTIALTGRITVADVEALAPEARESLVLAFREHHAGSG